MVSELWFLEFDRSFSPFNTLGGLNLKSLNLHLFLVRVGFFHAYPSASWLGDCWIACYTFLGPFPKHKFLGTVGHLTSKTKIFYLSHACSKPFITQPQILVIYQQHPRSIVVKSLIASLNHICLSLNRKLN